MVTTYGMSDSLGPLALGAARVGRLSSALRASRGTYSERVAEAIDAEVRVLIDAGMRPGGADLVAAIATCSMRWRPHLLDDETVEGDELEADLPGGWHAANGVVTPLPRYRQRPGAPSLAADCRGSPPGLASTTLPRRRTTRQLNGSAAGD